MSTMPLITLNFILRFFYGKFKNYKNSININPALMKYELDVWLNPQIYDENNSVEIALAIL